MKYLLFMVFLASCAQTPINETPAWVEAIRSGEESIKVAQGSKTYYRRIAGSPALTREISCSLAITRAEETIKKEYPNADFIPYAVEVVFYDKTHKDCAVTVSLSSKLERSLASIVNKDNVTEDEATLILQERARIASRFALTGITKPEFEKFAKDKVSLNSDHALCSKYFSTGSFSVHGTTHVCWKGENVVGYCTMNDSTCWTKNP